MLNQNAKFSMKEMRQSEKCTYLFISELRGDRPPVISIGIQYCEECLDCEVRIQASLAVRSGCKGHKYDEGEVALSDIGKDNASDPWKYSQ